MEKTTGLTLGAMIIAASGQAQQPVQKNDAASQPKKKQTPSKKDINEKIISLAAKASGLAPSKILPTSSFTRELNMDSLDAVELVMELENEYAITVPDVVLEKAFTVEKLADAVSQILQTGVVVFAPPFVDRNQLSDPSIIYMEKGFDRILLSDSIQVALKRLGDGFEQTRHGGYSVEYVYPEKGISFFVKLTKTGVESSAISEIRFTAPFKGKLSPGNIRIGSKFLDVKNAFGVPTFSYGGQNLYAKYKKLGISFIFDKVDYENLSKMQEEPVRAILLHNQYISN